jgi:hypothetical protein
MEIIKILPVKSDQRTTLDNHFHASEPVKGDHPKILATAKPEKLSFSIKVEKNLGIIRVHTKKVSTTLQFIAWNSQTTELNIWLLYSANKMF